MEGSDGYALYHYGKSRHFNDELIKDKFYTTTLNPCIFMTQPPNLMQNNKESIIFIDGLIKNKHFKVYLIKCCLEHKIPLIIYDYAYDLVKQKIRNNEDSMFYIQKFMHEIFEKFTDTSGKNIIISVADSYLEVYSIFKNIYINLTTTIIKKIIILT